jgi:hypothetical protein
MLRELAGSKISFENPKLYTLETMCGLHDGKPSRSENPRAEKELTPLSGDNHPDAFDLIIVSGGLTFPPNSTGGPLRLNAFAIIPTAHSGIRPIWGQ